MGGRPIGAWVFAAALAAATGGGLCPAQQQAQSAGIEIGVRGWRSDLSLDISADKYYIPGTGFDENAIGLDGSQLIPVPYARLGGLGHYLIVDYVQAEYEGSKTLGSALTISGMTFPSGSFIESELNVRIISGYYNYALTDPNGSFQAGVLAGVKYHRIEADIEGGGDSGSMRLTAPAPVVGSLARLTLFEGLDITAQLDYLQLPESILGMKAMVFEGLAEVTLRAGYFSAGIGYHYFRSEFTANVDDDDEIEFGMKMKGPYAVIALIF